MRRSWRWIVEPFPCSPCSVPCPGSHTFGWKAVQTFFGIWDKSGAAHRALWMETVETSRRDLTSCLPSRGGKGERTHKVGGSSVCAEDRWERNLWSAEDTEVLPSSIAALWDEAGSFRVFRWFRYSVIQNRGGSEDRGGHGSPSASHQCLGRKGRAVPRFPFLPVFRDSNRITCPISINSTAEALCPPSPSHLASKRP